MGSEWPVVRLGDYVDSSLGKMLDAKKNKGELQPYLGNSNVRWGQFDLSDLAEMRFEEHEQERYQLLPGDLVVCEGGEPGRCAIWRGQIPGMKIQKALHRVRAKPGLKNEYLYYWLTLAARLGTLEPYFTGTTIKHLTGRALADLELPLPPITVQESIVSTLGVIDERIDCLRQINHTLEAIAQALFKSWFVDFDPVRAKVEGREPEGMDTATGRLFPSGFEESELGPFPKSWAVTNVGEVAELIKGCSYKGAGLSDTEGDYMFNLGCFNAKRMFATENIKRYTLGYRERQSVVAGDLIMANTDMTQQREILGRAMLVPTGCEPAFVSHHVFKVAIRRSNADQWRRFLFFAFQQSAFRERAVGHATGTTVLSLARDSAEKCPIIEPDQNVLATFDASISPLMAQIANNLHRMRNLEELRDTLLPRLISGKLRLPEAEQEVEAATE